VINLFSAHPPYRIEVETPLIQTKKHPVSKTSKILLVFLRPQVGNTVSDREDKGGNSVWRFTTQEQREQMKVK
jgi:hypothetical protein